ncbi:5'-3' exonuclease [Halalkalibacterium halodurans]|uniref:5'-3' exonuclease n=1 Tax=Halalkalibacterium halodurans (strain ATCC BAA-125 / DSM 18197 / FERM 7344 / JCM 9153 / C-125) TaxID=272558 RepID=EX53_HALH5|nr:5'-3' exonuclease [Halalkalibacterium halodurans]Q9KAV6.1 RecName: Full=5'-3' exonuclease [Halalkalibacterium halodurans C-125]MED4082778.1 5'-3' exonuclease [Halalkalibacterium halodurans]MED4087252.1 5'-3' exonuclease [Halalkalibacterium halodurans]MED4105731.1 5'-3' exonuclease [Halalkalibacterium halodurans]MED4110903.1 5'-3' exonuclease [Halalkalibacterium halodurans]MED4123652.1 5'-3' exonuclease [Halalkalibacterium halodurans]
MHSPVLLLIDGFNLLSRGYFATSYGKDEAQLPRNEAGYYINALRVFFPKLFQLIREHNVTHVAVAWDVKREDSHRRQAFAFYKASRGELPEALIEQYETATSLLEEIGVAQVTIPPYEADDTIGAFACRWAKEEKGHCFIYSNDRDLLQLLSKSTSQIISSKGKDLIYTEENFRNDYNISPAQWVDVKALLGDKSDNIPGCPGVGEKSALPLIQQYGTIETLYEQIEDLDPKYKRYHKKLVAGEESVIISKELATITTEIEAISSFSLNSLVLTTPADLIIDTLARCGIRVKLAPVQTELKLG